MERHSRYIALTGLPRSGSTLCCHLVNAAAQAVALFEPMQVHTLAADDRRHAVGQVLADGVRTADLMGPDGGTPVSTSEMGDKIVAALAGR